MYRIFSFTLALSLFGIMACQPPITTATDQQNTITDAMLGQLIMQGFKGIHIDSIAPAVVDQIKSGEIGHVILFDYDAGTKSYDRNIVNSNQVRQLLTDLQAAAAAPMLTAVDQEGGLVMRLKSRYGFPQLPNAAYLGQLNNNDTTTHYATLNATKLADLGFNVNFAPVVDLNVNPDNPVIGKIHRSFSEKTNIVVAQSQAWIAPHRSKNILSVLKHFPGHGSSTKDSHKDVTDITHTWTPQELMPFQLLLQQETLTAVMTAHVFNQQVDSLYPATLSPHYINGILRDSFHYQGVVFSDDLHMKAVNDHYDFKTIIRQTINAGVDILVFSNNIADYDDHIARKAIACMRELLTEGSITDAQIMNAYQRVQQLKVDLYLH